MAQYKHLPIYKTTYELLKLITEKTKGFPRDFKFSLGDKIHTECIELVIFVYKANSLREQRKENIAMLLERVQVIELMLRLSRDLHLINVETFSEIVELTDSLARQAQGWLNHTTSSRAD